MLSVLAQVNNLLSRSEYLMNKETKIMSYTAFTVWLWLWPWKLNHPDFHFLLPEVPDWTDFYYIPRETKEREASTTTTTHSSPVCPSPVSLYSPGTWRVFQSFLHFWPWRFFSSKGLWLGPALLLLVLDRWIHSRVHLLHARVKRPQKYILLWLFSSS